MSKYELRVNKIKLSSLTDTSFLIFVFDSRPIIFSSSASLCAPLEVLVHLLEDQSLKSSPSKSSKFHDRLLGIYYITCDSFESLLIDYVQKQSCKPDFLSASEPSHLIRGTVYMQARPIQTTADIKCKFTFLITIHTTHVKPICDKRVFRRRR